MYWISHAATHTGYIRNINEDAYLAAPQSGLWVVADGMGGHHAGDIASTSIISALRNIHANKRLSYFVNDVEDRVFAVNKRLRQMAEEKGEHCTIGSTIVALLTSNNHCVIMWAGDSRAYLLRKHDLIQVTRDHSETEELIQRGLLDPEEAESHPASNIITRAVGVSTDLHIDINLKAIEPGDKYLLCSDGLYKHVTHDEIATILQQENVHNITRDLINLTLERGATDNVTVVVAAVSR